VGAGIVLFAAVLAAVAVWLVYWQRSRRQFEGTPADHARPVKLAALMLIGLGAGFFLTFAVAELAGGDVAGAQHLPPAAFLGALLWLGWKRPRAAGIALLVVAVPLGAALLVAFAVEGRPAEVWVPLSIALPPILAGWLLLRAGREPRPR
jgi:hypothetical protein